MLDYLSSFTKKSNKNQVRLPSDPFVHTLTLFADRLLPPSSGMNLAVAHSVSAAAAGAIATMVTHPFDVVKVLHVPLPAAIRSTTDKRPD